MDNLFNITAQEPRFARRHAPFSSSSSSSSAPPTLPALSTIRAAEASLPDPSSPSYLAGAAPSAVALHIARDIAPALTGQNASSRYLGFVTGGALPLAEWADNVVSALDQNVQVHLPTQTVATAVEDAALEMLARLLRLLPDNDDDDDGCGGWRGRTLTTGATASNVLGLACGREHVIGNKFAAAAGEEEEQQQQRAVVGEMGLLAAARAAGVDEIQVLTSMGHSSLGKAASVVGLGRRAVRELRLSEEEPWRFDMDAAEAAMQRPGVATILAMSAGEVNTGRYALRGIDEWKRVRALADRYGAWIHVDGAFGVFARALEQTDQYKVLHQRLDGIELADSITIDGHKLLNVPYDCGMFFCKSPTIVQAVFTNPDASYLSSSGTASSIPSPLNMGIENSRRFRALPVYAVLLSEGRPGLAALLGAMTQLARAIAAFLRDSPDYELLPENDHAEEEEEEEEIFISVLFRAADAALNETLVAKINDTRQLYVSGTTWRGRKAARIAVSNWRVDAKRDAAVVREILTCVAQGREFDLEANAARQEETSTM
ncbi:hypothetical protein NHJ13734_004503 [Beauveria thailandica]